MKTVFLCAFMSVQLVKFDTQDNVHLEAFQFPNGNEWQQTLDLDTFEPINNYGLRREDGKLRFKSKDRVSTIRLNNFPYRYKVKKISPYEFEVRSSQLQKYFDGTDIVHVIVKFK